MLERVYDTGTAKISLLFQPLLDLPTMELYVAEADTSDQQYTGKSTVQIGSAGEPFLGSYFSVRSPKTKQRFTRLTVDRAALDTVHDGDVLTVKAKPVNRSFVIAGPEKAKSALRTCIVDLKKFWGIPEADPNSPIVTPPRGKVGQFFGVSDYPKEAIKAGAYGRVIAYLAVGADGAVKQCRILSSAGTTLNAGTCKVAMRARFEPARDAAGKAVPSSYILPVRWVLPGTQE